MCTTKDVIDALQPQAASGLLDLSGHVSRAQMTVGKVLSHYGCVYVIVNTVDSHYSQ